MNEAGYVSDLFGVAGKRALVTGATSGIGRMIANGLKKAGVEVWTVARGFPDSEDKNDPNPGAKYEGFIQADITTEAGLETIADALGERTLHILVNNAGTNRNTPLDAPDRGAFEEVVALNLTAPFLLTQRLIGNLRSAASKDDPARVINIASVASLDPGPFENYAYSSSKSGLVMLTRHLARRLAPEGITCNAVGPGIFLSRLTEEFLGMGADQAPPAGFGAPLGNRPGSEDEISGAVLYLSSRPGAWVTGTFLPVSGGMSVID